ncbi:DUF5590 domain-containing protein [Thalassobacillus cyri]|nr:DUF5590 domain-containing protein [Thalassobacillus cyri]
MMIRTQQSSRSTVPDWVKWTVLGCIVIGLILTIAAYWFYTDIMEDKQEGYGASKQIAVEETALIDIDSIQRYNGNEALHIVSGATESGEHGYAFISKKNKQLVTYVKKEELADAASLEKAWQENCDKCEWIDIKLGLEDDRTVWEMTYIDEQGRYVIAHYDAESGERYQQFAFRRS